MRIVVRPDASSLFKSTGFISLTGIASFALTVGNFIVMPQTQNKMAVCITQFYPNINPTTVVGIIAVIGMALSWFGGEIYTPRGMIGPNKPHLHELQETDS